MRLTLDASFRQEYRLEQTARNQKRVAPQMRCNPSYRTDFNSFYFTLSTIALKASGLLTARSARTLRLISIPDLLKAPINVE